jgi:UDP-GlcNAc3NAcA epimerase
MYDAILHFKPLYQKSDILNKLNISPHKYVLATVHRASNTDNTQNLQNILTGLNNSGKHCIFPVHPRTKNSMDNNGLETTTYPNIHFIQPLGYLDFMAVASNASSIVTDSGGLQKEAYWHGVPCITVRTETEWVETVDAGWNRITGTDSHKISEAINTFKPTTSRPDYFGNGQAAQKIVQAIST